MRIVFQCDKDKLEYIKDLKETIHSMRTKGLARLFFMLLRSIKIYYQSLAIFGSKGIVTQEVLNIWNEYFTIKKKENKIFSYLLEKKNEIDYCSFCVDEYLLELDDLSEQTEEYFENVLGDIEYACDTREEYRAKRMPKDFETLIEEDYFVNKLVESTISIKDIIKFLKLPKKFIRFMRRDNFRIYELEDEEESTFFYGVNFKEDENGKLSDIKLMIPVVIDLKTALINVKEYQKAYELYQRIHKKLNEEDIKEILDSARNCEKQFQKEYCKQKITTKLQ